jgi:SAM-dependent methyltransferase
MTDLYGLQYGPGSPEHHRAYVGPSNEYDLIGGLQFTVLFQLGLRETHTLLDVGCGSLRAGRLLIPYLRPGHYWGLEPNGWLVEKGIAHEIGDDLIRIKQPKFVEDFDAVETHFDFVLAQSIFSHTFADLAAEMFGNISRALEEDGLLIANYAFRQGQREGSGWTYNGNVSYRWEEIQEFAENAGLKARALPFFHPRLRWFTAGKSSV